MKQSAVVTFLIGTVEIADSRGAQRKIEVGCEVRVGDVITTGDKSCVILQMGDLLIARIQANSRVKVASLFMKDKGGFILDQGSILTKIRKLQKDSSYSIKTPTTTIAVRGTVFGVQSDKGGSIVTVLKGKVSVEQTEKRETKMVDEGSAAIVTKTIRLEKITDLQRLELYRVDRIDFIKPSGEKAPEEMKKRQEEIKNNDQKIDEEIEKLSGNGGLPKTLEEIRAKYGRIDRVIMYSGKTYLGKVLSQGAVYKVLVPGGKVLTLKGDDVENVEPM